MARIIPLAVLAAALLVTALLAAALGPTAPALAQGRGESPYDMRREMLRHNLPGAGNPMQGDVTRHQMVYSAGVPARYAGHVNPLPPVRAVLQRGGVLFATNCRACHGDYGRGDGPLSSSLVPRPSNLDQTIAAPLASDAFLFWSIAEGGAPTGSAMPVYKTVMSEDDIWSVIRYMRAGFPPVR